MSHALEPMSPTFTAPSPRSLRASLESRLDAVVPDVEPAFDEIAASVWSLRPPACFGLRGRNRDGVESERA
jgi:hypothetical protein